MTEPFDSIELISAALRSANASLAEVRLTTTEMRDVNAAALAAAQARYDELKVRYDALVNPPPPPPLNPSGQRMPTEDLPGYRLSWSEDFNTPAEPGQIRDVYGNKMKFYPPKPTTAFYSDTSGRGHYETNNLSAKDGKLRYHVYTSPENGIHHVGAVLPTLSDLGGYGAVDGGRFAVRWRSDHLSTYKIAWLLWPLDGDWPKNGEIDFPECSLAGSTIQGFMHRQDAVPGPNAGADQDSVSKTADPRQWHTCVIEWKAGAFCRFILDGVLIKNVTARVPKTPMRWTLQTETTLNKSVTIDNTANGYVEIDWLAYWAPA